MGRFGSALAKALYDAGAEVLAVDMDRNRADALAAQVSHVQIADCRDMTALKALDAGSFDVAVVAMSGNLEASVMITMLLKEIGVPTVIAKASSELHEKVLKQIGADRVVLPERDMGQKIAQGLTVSNMTDYFELSDRHTVAEIRMPAAWIGKTLRTLNVRAKYHVNVVAVKNRNTHTVSVTLDPDETLTEEEDVVVVGENNDLEKLLR